MRPLAVEKFVRKRGGWIGNLNAGRIFAGWGVERFEPCVTAALFASFVAPAVREEVLQRKMEGQAKYAKCSYANDWIGYLSDRAGHRLGGEDAQ